MSAHALSPENLIHIWSITFNQPTNIIDQFEQTLSEEELEKANRFKFDHLKTNYIVSHGALRNILAHYINKEPKDIVFEKNEHGKPFIHQSNSNPIKFNLSHTNHRAVIAVTYGKEIGIDIEDIHPISDYKKISKRFFTKNENDFINQQTKGMIYRFFEIWTKKEAIIKAIGLGLFQKLNEIDVTSTPISYSNSTWHLYTLELFQNTILSIAFKGKPSVCIHHPWQESHIKNTQFIKNISWVLS